VVSSDGTRGVIRRDITVLSDGTHGVIWRDTWFYQTRARVDAVGWLTTLQAARSRVLFSIVSLEFLIHINLLAALWFQTEMSTSNISWGIKPADNFTTFMCALSWNLSSEFSFKLSTLQLFWQCLCIAMHWLVRFQSTSTFDVFRLLGC
jgi:hypothetical protein